MGHKKIKLKVSLYATFGKFWLPTYYNFFNVSNFLILFTSESTQWPTDRGYGMIHTIFLIKWIICLHLSNEESDSPVTQSTTKFNCTYIANEKCHEVKVKILRF